MKTLIISSSRNPESLSFKVCTHIKSKLEQKEGTQVNLIDLKEMEINFAFQPKTPDQEKIHALVEEADSIIFGTPIYNYTISDSLKAILDTCFPGKEHQLFGICAAAGGERSYLATTDLIQTCIKQWRMIPLPRVIYCTSKDFTPGNATYDQLQPTEDLEERIQQFTEDFHTIGKKLLS